MRERPEPAAARAVADGAIAWRADQPPVAQLPVAGRTRPASRARRRCASCSSSTRPPPTSSAQRQIEGVRSVRVRPVVRRLPGRGPIAFGRGLEITRRRRRDGVRGRQRVPARRGARAVLRALRVDQLVHRDGAAIAEPRRDQAMGATMGRETDALSVPDAIWRGSRTATTSSRRCAGSSACTPTSRAGERRCGRATSRCASARSPTLAFAPAPLASFEFGQRRRAAAAAGAVLRPARAERAAAAAPHRVRARAAAARRRPDARRFLDLFHHRFLALFYRAWAQAQPHVSRDRPDDDRFAVYVGRVRRASRRRRCATATRCPTSRKLLSRRHAGRARCATPRGWRAILRQFFRVPVRDRAVRRALAARWRRASARDLRPRRRATLGARRGARRARAGTARASSASVSGR